MAKRKAPHHMGTHQVRARQLTALAYANPDTRCGRCGSRLHEPPHKRGDRWEAGHIVDGQIGGALRPEARSCNRRASAERTNAKRRAQGGHRSASW